MGARIFDSHDIRLMCVLQNWRRMPDLNIGSIPLGEHDQDWLIVMSKLGNKSLRAQTASVVRYYLNHRKAEYQEMLEYTARKYGISNGECFHRLLKGEELGTPVENFTELPPSIRDDG